MMRLLPDTRGRKPAVKPDGKIHHHKTHTISLLQYIERLPPSQQAETLILKAHKDNLTIKDRNTALIIFKSSK